MKKHAFASNSTHGAEISGFDLFRLTKAKQVVDISPNTLRKFHRQGLPFYSRGRAVFISKAELSAFLRTAANHIPE